MLVSRNPSHGRNDCIVKNNLAIFSPYIVWRYCFLILMRRAQSEASTPQGWLWLSVPLPSSVTWGRLLPCGKREYFKCFVSWAGSPMTKVCGLWKALVTIEAVTQKPLKISDTAGVLSLSLGLQVAEGNRTEKDVGVGTPFHISR